jgi:CRISPR/Cas system CSM-associated protein Csm2 small subunit
MRVDNISQQNFGQLSISTARAHFKDSQIRKIFDMIEKQKSNHVNIDVFENPMHEFSANIYISKPYFYYDEIFNKSSFSSKMGFLKRMCKKADKISEEYDAAKNRYEMFINKNGEMPKSAIKI